MQDFTRRTLLQGGTALAATGMLTGPALFEFAKAWAQSSPWKAEQGAKLTVKAASCKTGQEYVRVIELTKPGQTRMKKEACA